MTISDMLHIFFSRKEIFMMTFLRQFEKRSKIVNCQDILYHFQAKWSILDPLGIIYNEYFGLLELMCEVYSVFYDKLLWNLICIFWPPKSMVLRHLLISNALNSVDWHKISRPDILYVIAHLVVYFFFYWISIYFYFYVLKKCKFWRQTKNAVFALLCRMLHIILTTNYTLTGFHIVVRRCDAGLVLIAILNSDLFYRMCFFFIFFFSSTNQNLRTKVPNIMSITNKTSCHTSIVYIQTIHSSGICLKSKILSKKIKKSRKSHHLPFSAIVHAKSDFERDVNRISLLYSPEIISDMCPLVMSIFLR